MKSKFLFTLLYVSCTYGCFSQNSNTSFLKAKYDFSVILDTTSKNEIRKNDLFVLKINKISSNFYSEIRHFGIKQRHDYLQKNSTDGVISIDNSKMNFGDADKESECVEINFDKKYYRVYDRISKTPHYYEDSLTTPVWMLLPDTITILNEPCQKATSFYRGRNIIAWFAKNIPLQQGPWLYNGLPGLIMKVEDTRDQFSFVCRELIAKPQTEPVFIEYENAEKVSKEIALKRKRLYIEDPIASSAQEWGVTMSYPGFDTNKPRKKKPYNPLDLGN